MERSRTSKAAIPKRSAAGNAFLVFHLGAGAPNLLALPPVSALLASAENSGVAFLSHHRAMAARLECREDSEIPACTSRKQDEQGISYLGGC